MGASNGDGPGRTDDDVAALVVQFGQLAHETGEARSVQETGAAGEYGGA